MKPSTTAKLSTIAKMIARDNPAKFQEYCEKCEPMLKSLALVPVIHSKIKEEFPDLDRTDQSILFAATCYFAYCPATIVGGSDLERAPNGIRKQMCNVMEWKDLPTVNYYSKISQVYFKGNTFNQKVKHILSFFQGYSVKTNQTQLF